MQADTVSAVAAVVASMLAVGTVIFHVGYSWNTLRYLKENSATKTDLQLVRSELMQAMQNSAEQAKSDVMKKTPSKEICDERHHTLDRRLDQLEG